MNPPEGTCPLAGTCPGGINNDIAIAMDSGSKTAGCEVGRPKAELEADCGISVPDCPVANELSRFKFDEVG